MKTKHVIISTVAAVVVVVVAFIFTAVDILYYITMPPMLHACKYSWVKIKRVRN